MSLPTKSPPILVITSSKIMNSPSEYERPVPEVAVKADDLGASVDKTQR